MLAITNARIYGHPGADTLVAGGDGRIAFVGRRDDASITATAHTIDARGQLLLPGFTDSHVHLLATGAAMRSVDLKAVPSVDEAVRRVADRVATAGSGEWITGDGWDQNDWPGAAFPTRHDLDAVAPANPVVLNHTSRHAVWVNSAALRAAGITAATPAPEGGAIDIGDDGEPSGILRDNAQRLVAGAMPRPTQAGRIAAIETAVAHAHTLGVTAVHAMNVSRGEFQALHALNDARRLTLRVRAFLAHERLGEWIERGVATGDGDAMFRIGGVKFFADGALGSLTAWMFEPYASSGDCGFPLQPVPDLERDVRRALEHGLAPAIHAIGDRANHETLDILERARDLAPDLPRRIEHAQTLLDADIARFASLGVAASVQPIHATQDMRKAERELGPRAARSYPFASLLRAGARLAFGSDTPVETMDPLAGIHAAVTRRRADGAPPGGWRPGQRISIPDAIAAYTTTPAAIAGDPPPALTPGAPADVVLLSQDITALGDPMRILDARVTLTVVAGTVVYERTPE